MYEELLHSSDRPFRATPDVKFYYPHDSIEATRHTVARAVKRAEGPVMVLGGAGLGKSLLGLIIADDLSPRFDAVKLHAARLCSRRALLQNILFELQLPYRDLSEGELRLSILDRLEPSSGGAPDGIVILVDEAHTLPAKLLDELRLITNFTRANQPRARLVLIGNLRLEDTFAQPQMESFNQRLAARCYLQPMNRQQTREYVRHQLQIAGLNPREFITDDGLETVYAASEGVPRLSNQIMDHALVLAVSRNEYRITSNLIEEAWADLQQLPAPWHSGADKYAAVPTGAAIEFGSLDMDDLPKSFAGSSPEESHTLLKIGPASDNPQSVPPEERMSTELRSASQSPGANTGTLPGDAELHTRKTNFFTAFAPPDENIPTFEATASDPFADEERASSELLVRPTVEFDPSNIFAAGRHATGHEHIEANHRATDGFFNMRPTDEMMLALEDEQAEYDAMGVWENDPPLLARALETQTEVDLLAQDLAASNKTPCDLFGDGFDEEVEIPTSAPQKSNSRIHILLDQAIPIASPALAPEKPGGESDGTAIPEAYSLEAIDCNPLATVDDIKTTSDGKECGAAAGSEQVKQAAEAADYIARIQECADTVAKSPSHFPDRLVVNVDDFLPQCEGEAAGFDALPPVESWSVDVASVDVKNEIAVQSEIEDLVSQLNFAAFSVEPYSVEQISLEPRETSRLEPIPSDCIRTGDNDEIYTLHRPRELADKSLFGDWDASYDDDRDLLVVDEELPVGAPVAELEQPVTKIAPYSQLFAKLRK